MAAAVVRRLCASSTDWLDIELVKFTRKTLCNGAVRVFCSGAADTLPNDAIALLKGRTEQWDVLATFVPDPTRPVTRRIDSYVYQIEDLKPGNRFSSICYARARDTETFLLTLIEVNKRTIKTFLPPGDEISAIEVVYIENMHYEIPEIFREGRVEVKNIGTKEFGCRTYVLNTLCYTDVHGNEREMRVNFSIHAQVQPVS